MRFAALVTLATVTASATAQTLTGQYDCTPAGEFTLCQNLWGECEFLIWLFPKKEHVI